MNKKIKAIEFGGIIKGQGIVNFDGSEQKWTLIERGFSKILPHNDTDGKVKDNIKYAKKNIYFNGETGKYDYKIKISRDCLIHNMYPDIPVVNPTIANDDWMRCKFSTSMRGIASGLMFIIRQDSAKKNGTEDMQNIAKKSSISLRDAYQIKGDAESEFGRHIKERDDNFSVSSFEFCSRAGEKDDTSVHFNENIGNIKYEVEGRIDVDLLQFLKTTPILGNFSIDENWVSKGFFTRAMKSHYGELSDDCKVGHYAHPAEIEAISGAYCQMGIRLGDKLVSVIVKDVLKRLFGLYIQTNKAYAKMDRFGIRFVYDDITEQPEEFTEIKSVADIDALDMEFYDFWVEATDDDIIAHKKLAEEIKRDKKEILDKKKNKTRSSSKGGSSKNSESETEANALV